MKTKRTLHPEDYCIGENELYYSRMASKGWRLEKRGRYLSRFSRSGPVEEVYRIEVDYRELPEEQIALFDECGWEFVTKYGYVNVFRAPAGSGAPEFYWEPAEQAQTLRRMRRRDLVSWLVALAILVPYMAVILSMGGGISELGPAILRGFVLVPGLPALWFGALFYCLAQDVESGIRFGRMIRRLRSGKNLDHSPKKRRMIHAYVMLAFAAVCAASLIAQLSLHKKTDMPEVPDGPYATLSELGIDGERAGITGLGPDCRVTRDWSPLCDILQTRETLIAGDLRAFAYQDIYELRVPALTESFARSLIYKADLARDPADYEELEAAGWDKALVSRGECVAWREGMAVHIYLYAPGREDMTELLIRTLTAIGGSGTA